MSDNNENYILYRSNTAVVSAYLDVILEEARLDNSFPEEHGDIYGIGCKVMRDTRQLGVEKNKRVVGQFNIYFTLNGGLIEPHGVIADIVDMLYSLYAEVDIEKEALALGDYSAWRTNGDFLSKLTFTPDDDRGYDNIEPNAQHCLFLIDPTSNVSIEWAKRHEMKR